MMHTKIKKGLIISGVSILSFILLLALFFSFIYIGIFGPLPSQEELKDIHKEEASLVLSSDGKLLGKFFAENRTNISFKEIPPHLLQALIATEDKRFYEHEGYDVRSYFRVFFKSILLGDKSSGGGSTITQQLVKNLYGRNYHSFLSMPINKVKEAIIAARMEEVYSKEEILLLYLNSVPFGEEVFGIEAAAIRYFDKHAFELNIQESAVLVGVLKANTFYNPRLNPNNATGRRNQVIQLMAKEEFISTEESDSIQQMALDLSYANYQIASPAAYFVRQVKKRVTSILEDIKSPNGQAYNLEKDGLVIHTSLNSKIQEFASQASQKQLSKMQLLLDKELNRRNYRRNWEKSLLQDYSKTELTDRKNREVFDWDGIKVEEMSLADSLWHYHKMLNSAVLITEPSTARVLSWLGGNNYRYLPYDMIFAQRQIASTIKPFIYAAGIESGLSSCDYLENEVKEYEAYKGWKPENYNHQQTKDSSVAMWYALINSMNLPTVDLYFKTGHDAVADLLRRLNIHVPKNETPALALGALDASLYEMTLAYGTLANGGNIHKDLSMIDSITDANGYLIYKNPISKPSTAIDEQVCAQISSILQKAINEGTGRQIRYRFGIRSDLAGKTGTAQNYSNAWFMSFTPNLVIGTWVGARSPEVHFKGGLGSGSALALPISGDILQNIEKNKILKNEYLNSFSTDTTLLSILDCPAYKEKGVDGFFHRLFNGKGEDKNIKVDSGRTISKKDKRQAKKDTRRKKKEDKEKTKVGKFFDRLFKGKKGDK
ncbi:transglycosylase domain-containing protein [Lentimicrobium sp. S6]|uniref:transglycosylase domain-containing protein n=1 Tax=Lentimicrobium sp. S6 TaxID=2735872 RepID=UPI0015548969|nr:transglycosylase domain-containing protein [Lentimicrobium sp. S6]NPD45585.1 penicillin-binding protein [Lentimicrobium sp. S6]